MLKCSEYLGVSGESVWDLLQYFYCGYAAEAFVGMQMKRLHSKHMHVLEPSPESILFIYT